MFTHSAPLDSSFSMHDCRATGLRIEKDALILTFEDGVWACAGSAINPCEKTIRTGRAEVRLDGFTAEETELAYFRELRFFGWKAAELRKHLTLDALERCVNSGRWELEFKDAFSAGCAYLFRGLVWQKRRPYLMEFELSVEASGMTCFWDALRPECEW